MSEDPSPHETSQSLAKVVVDFVSEVPKTTEPRASEPMLRARAIAAAAALKASALSGSLALPPGPLGLLTVLPDLLGVWHIQAQMVADIAGAYGKTALLSREQMLYCLFKHAAAQVVRDLAMRMGERVLIRRASVHLLQSVAGRVGIVLTRRAIANSVARWLPAVGAAGVAAYAFYDTRQVATTAIELFSSDVEVETHDVTPQA
jgi:hypothetical protein